MSERCSRGAGSFCESQQVRRRRALASNGRQQGHPVSTIELPRPYFAYTPLSNQRVTGNYATTHHDTAPHSTCSRVSPSKYGPAGRPT